MSGAKRLAKRSIIGTRVSALWQQDGRYHPGVIRAVAAEATPVTDDLFTVLFDDGSESNTTSKNIVGAGFQSGPTGRLKHAQKVFTTLRGREVWGAVAHHDRRTDEVIIIVRQGNGEEVTVHRKVEELRLLESRKSARLVDQSTDYSKLADRHRGEQRRRVVSHSIDVPSSESKPRKRHSSCGEPEKWGDIEDVGVMDETVAAMVLTSLSVSPQSPTLPTQSTGYDSIKEHSYVSNSLASSGFCSGQSERGDPSPPHPSPPHPHLSRSAPPSFDLLGRVELSSDSDTRDSVPSDVSGQTGSEVKYRCIWRGCSSVFETINSVERHIRRFHLDHDSDIELSDNEEEFYYEEIDEDELLDSVTDSFAGMYTSSSLGGLPGSFETPSAFDHDYLRKDERSPTDRHASSVPSGGVFDFSESSTTTTTTLPISIPDGQIKRSLSWQVQGQSLGGLVSPPHHQHQHQHHHHQQQHHRVSGSRPSAQERLQQHQAQSPKSHMLSMSPHRRPRSEVRKCRKVYGMDRRDHWCTQCKWKKACTRFLD